MTSARPTQKRAWLAVGHAMSAVGAVALTLAVPDAAAAAPAPCERAEAYAAQSGAELLHVDKLDGGGRGQVSDVGLAQARSALVATAPVNSAAVTRLVDADRSGADSEPLIQQAPPTNATAARRSTDSGDIGPFALGRGALTSHARWDPRMACGRSAGEAARADAMMHDAGVGGWLHFPQKTRSRSTTAFAGGGRTVATAGVDATSFDLFGGAVHVKVVRPPVLTARMSTEDGGRVGYVPAVIEVSGDGIRAARLATPGDEVELALNEETGRRIGSSTMESVTDGAPLPLPAVPGLPRLGGEDESAHVSGSGTRLRIALGKVRQAAAGHAIAAKATAIRIAVTEGPSDDRGATDQTGASERNGRSDGSGGDRSDGYGGSSNRGRVVLDLGVGLLEAAAVAPEQRGDGAEVDVPGAVSAAGAGAGLPITGSRIDVVAMGGAALVIAGAVALTFGTRRRRFRP